MNNGDKKTGERLLKVIGLLQLEQTSFAQTIGVHRSSIYKIVDGVQRLSPSMVKRIQSIFPNVSAQFLTTGEGSPFVDNGSEKIVRDYIKANDLTVSQIAADTGLQETDVMDMMYSAHLANKEHLLKVIQTYHITDSLYNKDVFFDKKYVAVLEERNDKLNQEIGRLKAILSQHGIQY